MHLQLLSTNIWSLFHFILFYFISFLFFLEKDHCFLQQNEQEQN